MSCSAGNVPPVRGSVATFLDDLTYPPATDSGFGGDFLVAHSVRDQRHDGRVAFGCQHCALRSQPVQDESHLADTMQRRFINRGGIWHVSSMERSRLGRPVFSAYRHKGRSGVVPTNHGALR